MSSNVSLGTVKTFIKRVRFAAVIGQNDFKIIKIKRVQHFDGAVGRAVVNHNDLHIPWVVLAFDAAKSFRDILRLIVGGDQ